MNCGFIDEHLWVGSGYMIDGFTDLGVLSYECPASVYLKNSKVIKYLMFLSKGNFNPLELTYLENSALLEYSITSTIAGNIKAERNKS